MIDAKQLQTLLLARTVVPVKRPLSSWGWQVETQIGIKSTVSLDGSTRRYSPSSHANIEIRANNVSAMKACYVKPAERSDGSRVTRAAR